MGKQATVPINIIPIEEDGFHLHVKGVVNEVAVDLLIDTGASRTVFDKQMLEQTISVNDIREDDSLSTGLGTNTMKGELVTLSRFHLGDFQIENYEVAVLDLSHVNHTYEQLGHPMIHGVIGSDLLLSTNANISYLSKELTLIL